MVVWKYEGTQKSAGTHSVSLWSIKMCNCHLCPSFLWFFINISGIGIEFNVIFCCRNWISQLDSIARYSFSIDWPLAFQNDGCLSIKCFIPSNLYFLIFMDWKVFLLSVGSTTTGCSFSFSIANSCALIYCSIGSHPWTAWLVPLQFAWGRKAAASGGTASAAAMRFLNLLQSFQFFIYVDLVYGFSHCQLGSFGFL